MSLQNQKIIIAACEKHFQQNYDDCNHFLKAVAKELNIPSNDLPQGVNDNADRIVKYLEHYRDKWQSVTLHEAGNKASRGYFVVVGQYGADHKPYPHNNGHVAVLVNHNLIGYAGSLGGAYPCKGKKLFGHAWNSQNKNKDANMHYFIYML